jgi:hypothetical protein
MRYPNLAKKIKFLILATPNQFGWQQFSYQIFAQLAAEIHEISQTPLIYNATSKSKQICYDHL